MEDQRDVDNEFRPTTVLNEGQAYASNRGTIFAQRSKDLPDVVWQTTVTSAVVVICDVLQAEGLDRSKAIEAAELFSRAARVERQRLVLERTVPLGSA